jgi:hypothetical protein
MDLPSLLKAAMIPMDSMVLPEPPRRAAMIILGISIPSGCIDSCSKIKLKRPGWKNSG